MKLFEIKKLVGAPDNTKRDSIRRDLHFYVNKIKSWLVRLFVRIIGDNPILEKIWHPQDYIRSITISGDYAYVTYGFFGLSIIRLIKNLCIKPLF